MTTELDKAFQEASQKELAWRQAFNSVSEDVLKHRNTKATMKTLRDAETEYTAACVRLHQSMKQQA